MTLASSLPSYTELNTALKNAESSFQAPHVHGYVCGLLCATSGKLDTSWANKILTKKKTRATREMLYQLLETSYHLMSEFSFEFSLVLPSDGTDINIRTESLGAWCQGFLSGLQQYNIPLQNREPGEMTEALDDIIDIANISYGDIKSDDEDETAYFELVEYVRLAVLLIFQELSESDWVH